MSNESTTLRFENSMLSMLKDLSPSELRGALQKSYAEVGERARRVALASLRSKNFTVKGNVTDFESGLRLHIYSGGGGFLLTARGRRGATGAGAGELGMHENRFYGKTKRRLPILQWLESGAHDRNTRGTRKRKAHYTGEIRPSHFLTNCESNITPMVERDLMKDLDGVLKDISNKQKQ